MNYEYEHLKIVMKRVYSGFGTCPLERAEFLVGGLLVGYGGVVDGLWMGYGCVMGSQTDRPTAIIQC